MDKLVINSHTRSQLSGALSRPSHAYLFLGPSGLGKTTIARAFARELIGPNATAGDLKKWILLIAPEKDKKISIKQVRGLGSFVALKKPESISKKIVIIDKADHMGIESANALLLTLEEPTADTIIILVADNQADVVATLLSRLQKIYFKPPAVADMTEFSRSLGHEMSTLNSIGAFPAMLNSLDESRLEKHKTISGIAEAFMSSDLASRLGLVVAITDKNDTCALIDYLSRQISASGDGSVGWLKKANALILARVHLYNNGSPKFVLEKLALDFE